MPKIIRVGRDARDDAPRGELIVKRQIVVGRGAEGAATQIQHHIPDGAHCKTAPRPVDAPGADANQQHGQPDQNDNVERGLPVERVHDAANDDRRRGVQRG